MASGIDKDAVLAELVPDWLDGLEGEKLEEGRRLLSEVVDDWAREADRTPNPAAVLPIQWQDLEDQGRGRNPDEKLGVLRTGILARKADRLSARTFALGKAILEGSVDDQEARTQGESALKEAESE